MRRVAITILLLLIMPISMVEGRSVHATYEVDLFPNGDLENSSQWDIKEHLSFTPESNPENGEHTSGMIADNKITMGIDMPQNIDSQTLWSSSTSTDSNATMGSPDGAYTWSTGPNITMGGFQTSGLENNIITSVSLLIHFEVPNELQQDKIRFSTINNGFHNLVKNWGNTQTGLFYMTNGWSISISDSKNWSWNEIANMQVNLDYVSVGGTDDSQLRVDAVGLNIEMQTPWYGAERVTASSSNQVDSWPILDFDFTTGQLNQVSSAPCGLDSDGGTWTTDSIAKPDGQSWGRIHIEHNDEQNGTVLIEYIGSSGSWDNISNGLIPIAGEEVMFRFTISNTCLTKAWIDINDPTIHITGNIQGQTIGITENLSAWTVVVNGDTISNNPITDIGNFEMVLPIGHLLDSDILYLNITIKAFFTWDSDGSANSLSVVINSVNVDGGYEIEYDEDPHCMLIGNHELQEDGGGLILPLLTQCSDDRTDSQELEVTFDNSNSNLIEVDLTQGQIRVILVEEAHGVAEITTTVMDSAGNTWSEISTFTIAEVDDAPVLGEFPPVVPVQHQQVTEVPFTIYDVDSNDDEITISTNRSWASIDMTQGVVVVDAPTPGFTSVLITACDSGNNCVERELDLDVRALPDLEIEEIRVDSNNPKQGEVIEIKIMVRNSGQVEATMIGVRCFADDLTIGIGTIPVLQPGELGSVTCDWQVPYDDDSVLIEAVVDNGTEIDESNEDNNQLSKILGIAPAGNEVVEVVSESESQISQGMIWALGIGGLLLILAIFGLMAPAKIKKIE
jgi:hypothetical protein